jgi:transposase
VPWSFWTSSVANPHTGRGHLFVFRNRRGDKLKILYWDHTGYVLWYKRLERGVFHFPPVTAGGEKIGAAELALILEGIDLATARRRPRFRLPAPAPRA